jgi:hypothetical protein
LSALPRGGSLPGLCALIGSAASAPSSARGFADGMRTLLRGSTDFRGGVSRSGYENNQAACGLCRSSPAAMTANRRLRVSAEVNWQVWGVFLASRRRSSRARSSWFYRLALDERSAAAVGSAAPRTDACCFWERRFSSRGRDAALGISLGRLRRWRWCSSAGQFRPGARGRRGGGRRQRGAASIGRGRVPPYTKIFGFSGPRRGLCQGKARLAPRWGTILATGRRVLWAQIAGLGASVLYGDRARIGLLFDLPEAVSLAAAALFRRHGERGPPAQNPAEQAKKTAGDHPRRRSAHCMNACGARFPRARQRCGPRRPSLTGPRGRFAALSAPEFGLLAAGTISPPSMPSTTQRRAMLTNAARIEPGDLPAQFSSRAASVCRSFWPR